MPSLTLPTRLDTYAVGRSYVLQRATKIEPTMVDVEGSDVNCIVGSGSVMADSVVKQLGYSINRQYLDGCFDDDLDRYAWDRYQMVRKGASPAVAVVEFFRASGAAGSVAAGTKLRSLGGVEYVTTTTATFALNQVAALANVRAVQAGKTTQVGANAIRSLSSPGDAFDPTLQVTNPAASAGGEDVEDDDTFKSRVRLFWSTARRGILSAIEFGALTVPGVVTAMAVEALTVGGLPARVVNLYIADSSGVANTALVAQVVPTLNEYRAGGIAVIIFPSAPLIVSVQLQLAFAANVDTVNLTEAVRAAVVEFVNSLPVNGPLYLADLNSVIRRFAQDGVIPVQSNVVAPLGDLFPPVGQTIRTTLDNVTAS